MTKIPVATLLALLLPLAAGAAEKEDALVAKLRTRVEAIDSRLDGVLGLSLKDLKTGATVMEVRPAEPFPTASSIKLAVLYELYRQAEDGGIDLAALTTPPLPRVKGDGVLYQLGDHVTLTWRDVAVLMMGWSDNEGANLLMDKVGIEAVNHRLDSLHLPAVRLRRKMMDLDAARAGRENVGTPAQMRQLAETVFTGPGLSPERARDLRTVASITKKSPFREVLPEGVTILDKPGELEGVRCVSAVVDAPGRPYAISIMTAYLRRDADGEQAIRDISAAVYETFDRLARSSDLGRVISER
jgi:beta-lactamase class A